MTWTKLSDDFADDCEILTLAARWLHLEALCWSNRKLLDCRIPKAHLRRFASNPESVPELLAVRWWLEDGDAYVIRHHASYQRRRDQVLNQQAVNAENGRKGGRKPTKGTGAPREVAEVELATDSDGEPPSDSVSRSLIDSVPETHPLSDSPTERDGTGQDGTAQLEEAGLGDAPWPPVRQPPPAVKGLCVVCGMKTDPVLGGGVHPGCAA